MNEWQLLPDCPDLLCLFCEPRLAWYSSYPLAALLTTLPSSISTHPVTVRAFQFYTQLPVLLATYCLRDSTYF